MSSPKTNEDIVWSVDYGDIDVAAVEAELRQQEERKNPQQALERIEAERKVAEERRQAEEKRQEDARKKEIERNEADRRSQEVTAAQRLAQEQIAVAQEEARKIADAARLEAERIKAEAKQEADRIKADVESRQFEAFLAQQHKRLLELKDILLDAMRGVARDNLRGGSGTSASGMHQADAGSDDYDRDFALSMLSQEQGSLYEIDEALKRIEGGKYGICEICNKPINRDRLEALPFTRYSVDCQAELEKRQLKHDEERSRFEAEKKKQESELQATWATAKAPVDKETSPSSQSHPKRTGESPGLPPWGAGLGQSPQKTPGSETLISSLFAEDASATPRVIPTNQNPPPPPSSPVPNKPLLGSAFGQE